MPESKKKIASNKSKPNQKQANNNHQNVPGIVSTMLLVFRDTPFMENVTNKNTIIYYFGHKN